MYVCYSFKKLFVFYKTNKVIFLKSNLFIGKGNYKIIEGRKVMKKSTEMRKELVLGLIVLFLITTVIPITESLPIEKEQTMKTMSCSDGIIVSGWLGENGWYKSSVVLTLNVTGPINHTYFKIDDGAWMEYTMPVVVSSEGYHTACFYYVDHWGQYHMYNATFKIDKTLPDIFLTKEMIGLGQIKFVANVSDAMSGVWRVEFYVDDELMFTDFDFPFESNVFWAGKHNVVAIVFDFAGNSDIGVMSTPYVLNSIQKSLHHIYCFYYGFRITFMESFAFATS